MWINLSGYEIDTTEIACFSKDEFPYKNSIKIFLKGNSDSLIISFESSAIRDYKYEILTNILKNWIPVIKNRIK